MVIERGKVRVIFGQIQLVEHRTGLSTCEQVLLKFYPPSYLAKNFLLNISPNSMLQACFSPQIKQQFPFLNVGHQVHFNNSSKIIGINTETHLASLSSDLTVISRSFELESGGSISHPPSRALLKNF